MWASVWTFLQLVEPPKEYQGAELKGSYSLTYLDSEAIPLGTGSRPGATRRDQTEEGKMIETRQLWAVSFHGSGTFRRNQQAAELAFGLIRHDTYRKRSRRLDTRKRDRDGAMQMRGWLQISFRLQPLYSALGRTAHIIEEDFCLHRRRACNTACRQTAAGNYLPYFPSQYLHACMHVFFFLLLPGSVTTITKSWEPETHSHSSRVQNPLPVR